MLNKQRHPLFKVESRDKDILYYIGLFGKDNFMIPNLIFSQAKIASQKSSSVESFFQHYSELDFKDQLI